MSDTEKMTIPEAAVEAAAHGLARQAWGEWEYVPSELRELFLRDARIAIEAAAPHMLPLGPHPTWSSEVSPASNAHIANCPQCQVTFG